MYNDIDDVTTWLDTTANLIDTYEDHEKQPADGDGSRDKAVLQDEVQEEMVHVVEEILVRLIRMFHSLFIVLKISLFSMSSSYDPVIRMSQKF